MVRGRTCPSIRGTGYPILPARLLPGGSDPSAENLADPPPFPPGPSIAHNGSWRHLAFDSGSTTMLVLVACVAVNYLALPRRRLLGDPRPERDQARGHRAALPRRRPEPPDARFGDPSRPQATSGRAGGTLLELTKRIGSGTGGDALEPSGRAPGHAPDTDLSIAAIPSNRAPRVEAASGGASMMTLPSSSRRIWSWEKSWRTCPPAGAGPGVVAATIVAQRPVEVIGRGETGSWPTGPASGWRRRPGPATRRRRRGVPRTGRRPRRRAGCRRARSVRSSSSFGDAGREVEGRRLVDLLDAREERAGLLELDRRRCRRRRAP